MKKQAALVMTLALAACGGGSDFSQPNRPPVAQAGANQTVPVGATVTLAGSGTDPEQDVLSYLWTFTRPNASGAALSNTHVATPTFVADIAGVYTAALTVNDGKLSSPASTVTITAQVQTADFVKPLWKDRACASSAHIYVIDQRLVYTESNSFDCQVSNIYTLYDSAPGNPLCNTSYSLLTGLVAPPNCPGGATYLDLFKTIVNNRHSADLGLGAGHTVTLAYSAP